MANLQLTEPSPYFKPYIHKCIRQDPMKIELSAVKGEAKTTMSL